MEPFLEQIKKFSDLGTVVNEANVVICLLVSFALSLAIAKTYQWTYKGASFSPSFMHTLVICGMVIGAIMLIIGSNIARAFSLVGALSIIRFRTAVKDPRDVAFIFLVMAVGMACGSGFYFVACTLTFISIVCIFLMYNFDFGEYGYTEKLIKIQAPATKGFESMFNHILEEYTKSFTLVSVVSTKMATEIELTFSAVINKNHTIEHLIEALRKLNDNLRIEVSGTNFTFDL